MKEGLTKPGAHNLVLVCVHLVSIEWDTVKFLISMSQYFSSNLKSMSQLLSHLQILTILGMELRITIT